MDDFLPMFIFVLLSLALVRGTPHPGPVSEQEFARLEASLPEAPADSSPLPADSTWTAQASPAEEAPSW